MAYTPGEWKPVPCEDGTWNVMHEAGLFYWTLHETEDNAHLIATAPKLLKALKMLLDAAYDTEATGVPCVTLEPAMELAKTTIAQVEGEDDG